LLSNPKSPSPSCSSPLRNVARDEFLVHKAGYANQRYIGAQPTHEPPAVQVAVDIPRGRGLNCNRQSKPCYPGVAASWILKHSIFSPRAETPPVGLRGNGFRAWCAGCLRLPTNQERCMALMGRRNIEHLARDAVRYTATRSGFWAMQSTPMASFGFSSIVGWDPQGSRARRHGSAQGRSRLPGGPPRKTNLWTDESANRCQRAGLWVDLGRQGQEQAADWCPWADPITLERVTDAAQRTGQFGPPWTDQEGCGGRSRRAPHGRPRN